MEWMELKIQNLELQVTEAEKTRQYALDKLIDRDVRIADLQYSLECSKLLLEESIQITKSARDVEITDSYLNRVDAFLASHLTKQDGRLKFERRVNEMLARIEKEIQNNKKM